MTRRKRTRPTVVMSIRLADGTVHIYGPRLKPNHWRSWVVQQLPYGTVLLGAEWRIARADREAA